MKRVSGPLALLLLGTAVPAHAQHFDVKGEGARFDAAVIAGRVNVNALDGLRTVRNATTSGCTTHLISGKEDWTIDWTTASISDESTASLLMVSMGPTQDFAMRFGDGARLRTARSAGEHLGTACAR